MSDLDFGDTIKGLSSGQKVFGRYTLQKLIGRGGMGVVWLAADEKLETSVALKFLPEVVVHDPKAMDELKREARRNLQITHPNIVRIYDFVDAPNTAAIAMEYVDGATLAKLGVERPGGTFTTEELGPWLAQWFEAMTYAHEKARIVHRDLKPANLMVSKAGELKVTDFGIARSIADSVTRVSASAGTSGSPPYMSPQQLNGEAPKVSDDIYSIGATLFELLTGKPPFHTGGMAAIINQVMNITPPTVAARREEFGLPPVKLPDDWEETIAACLAKNPAQRPASVGDVAERLGLTTKDTKSTKQRTEDRDRKTEDRGQKSDDGKAGRVGMPRSSSKTPLYAGLAAAVLLLGGLGWYFGVQLPEQRRLAAEAKARTDQEQAAYTSVVRKIDAFADGSSAALRTSTDDVVKAYLTSAPEHHRADVQKRWSDRQTGWEAALKHGQVQREYEKIVAKIDAFLDGAPVALREATETAVQEYLARAPEGDKLDVEGRWNTRKSGWEAHRLSLARGGLRIRTVPEGAEVQVGSIALEKSPVTLRDLRLGKYPVVVNIDGYEEWRGEIEIKENEFSELGPIKLTRSTGALSVRGLPDGLQFTVSSNDYSIEGRTPALLKDIPTGSYSVVWRMPNGKPFTQKINVASQEVTETQQVDFRPARVFFDNRQSGVQIEVISTNAPQTGRVVGKTPFTSPLMLESGEYEVRLTCDKYVARNIKLQLGANETTTIATTLQFDEERRLNEEWYQRTFAGTVWQHRPLGYPDQTYEVVFAKDGAITATRYYKRAKAEEKFGVFLSADRLRNLIIYRRISEIDWNSARGTIKKIESKAFEAGYILEGSKLLDYFLYNKTTGNRSYEKVSKSFLER